MSSIFFGPSVFRKVPFAVRGLKNHSFRNEWKNSFSNFNSSRWKKIGNEMKNEMKSHLMHVLMSINQNKRYLFWLPFGCYAERQCVSVETVRVFASVTLDKCNAKCNGCVTLPHTHTHSQKSKKKAYIRTDDQNWCMNYMCMRWHTYGNWF